MKNEENLMSIFVTKVDFELKISYYTFNGKVDIEIRMKQVSWWEEEPCSNNVKLSLIHWDKFVYSVSKFNCLVSLRVQYIWILIGLKEKVFMSRFT